jgi:hypothetical protein
MFDIDKQLPSVFAMGKPIRTATVDPHIAAGGKPSAATGAGSGDGSDRRHAAVLQRNQHAVDPCLVDQGS